MGTFSRVVIVAVILLLAWFVISRVRALRVERRAGHEAGGTGENDPV